MLGNMMQEQLLISGVLEHAEKYNANTEIVSNTIEGGIHKYTIKDSALRSKKLANALLKLGIEEGDVIATMAVNSYRHLELYFGISGLGAVLHTLNPRLFPEDIKASNILILLTSFSESATALVSDSFDFNTYNSHGIVGLINTPTARFYDEGVHGITVYGSDIDQKITLTSNPYDWFEASFFYMNTEIEQTCRQYFDSKVYCQGYKDKGFNIKLRLKEEGNLPAIAIGLMDFAGTGIYSSEYIVSSYGIGKLDMHFGLGWGRLSGTNDRIKNPLGYIRESFYDRSSGYSGEGGQLNLSKYFSGKDVAPFYGISYGLNNKMLLKVEKDTTLLEDASLEYPDRET